MDIALLAGLGLALAGIAVGLMSSGGDIRTFIDFPSLMITVVGSLGSTIASQPRETGFKIIQIMMSVLRNPKLDFIGMIRTLVSFSEKARREGLLSLEENLEELEDPFLKKALQLVVDGTDPEVLKGMLYTEMELFEAELDARRAVLEAAGAFAPAFGMIGTLIGLISMLKSMNDPSTIGPSMAVALITTLYGSILANAFYLPMAEKLKSRAIKQLQLKRMILEGVLSIQAGENPRILEEKLKSFLPETDKAAYEKEVQEATA
ncbi:MAG: MotA/TolQ/ExbB proton channel family protein [Thermotogaceae bacterium]|nr:MotA/TolQ/ExbB proton channel family protein [Thermotogaceae bacterium]